MIRNKNTNQTNIILNDKKGFLKSDIIGFLETIKKDPEKEILIHNLLNYNENLPYSWKYLIYYEQKFSERLISYDTISETTAYNII